MAHTVDPTAHGNRPLSKQRNILTKLTDNLWLNRILPVLAVAALLLAAVLLVTNVQRPGESISVLNLWILGLGVLALLFLLSAIAARLLNLLQALRDGTPGAHLTRRLVLIFLLLTIPPVLIVYFFSLEFLEETIDGWLDVGQEQALSDSLELGRLFLDLRTIEAQREVRELGIELSQQTTGINNVDWFPLLIDKVSSNGPAELSILDSTGNVLATASINGIDFSPDRPNDFTLIQILDNNLFATAEPGNTVPLDTNDDNGVTSITETLKIRAAMVLEQRSSTDGIRILQAIYYLPPSFTGLASRIEKAFYQNQTVTFLRQALKVSFVIILTLVLLLSVLLAILAALTAAQRLVRPLTQLAQATGEVATGRYHQELTTDSADELGFLVESFNQMSLELEHSRSALEDQRQYLETVLGRLSAGVLSIDGDSRLVTSNNSASDILGYALEPWHGHPLQHIGDQEPRLQLLFQRLQERRQQQGEWREEINLGGKDKPLVLMCRGSQLPGLDGGLVVVFDDVTILTETQREAAWAEVAQRLAHEIKNPLTPIRLSAERLGIKLTGALTDDQELLLQKSTRTIVQQVESLQALVNAFGDYAREPRTVLQSVDLHAIIGDVLALYEAGDQSIEFTLNLEAKPALAMADSDQLRQVLHNLVRNAIEACKECSHPLQVSLQTTNQDKNKLTGITLDIRDNGPGVRSELLERIFEPYITSKTRGTGLGLAIVKRIIDQHGGSIRIQNLAERGAQVSLWLPAANPTKSPTLQ